MNSKHTLFCFYCEPDRLNAWTGFNSHPGGFVTSLDKKLCNDYLYSVAPNKQQIYVALSQTSTGSLGCDQLLSAIRPK